MIDTPDDKKKKKDEKPKETKATLKARDALKGEFAPGSEGNPTDALFQPDELDLFVNKVTLEAYIFHGKEVNYSVLERLEYDPEDFSIDVIKKDGTRLDLGVKAQWLIRPYFSKAHEVSMVRTKDGKSVDGVILPIGPKTAPTPKAAGSKA